MAIAALVAALALTVVLSLPACIGGGPVPTYTVSGTATDSAGEGLAGVQLIFSGGHGTATTDANGKWTKTGLTGTVTVTLAKEGYAFDPTSRTVSAAASNVDFKALPATLTITVVGKGTVQEQIISDKTPYLHGTRVQLTAVADTGWVFDRWEGDLTGTANPAELVMKSNKSVTAHFADYITVPGDYSSIQAAIDAASHGDTIVVLPGTYNENIRFNGKSITVRSLNPDDPDIVNATIINAKELAPVVTFDSSETSMSVLAGLTIQG